MFLSAKEVEQLTGYPPSQRVRTCRWLSKKGIPFTTNRLGDPVVLRSDVESASNQAAIPNFEFLKRA